MLLAMYSDCFGEGWDCSKKADSENINQVRFVQVQGLEVIVL